MLQLYFSVTFSVECCARAVLMTQFSLSTKSHRVRKRSCFRLKYHANIFTDVLSIISSFCLHRHLHHISRGVTLTNVETHLQNAVTDLAPPTTDMLLSSCNVNVIWHVLCKCQYGVYDTDTFENIPLILLLKIV